jgi:hypothetical protein
LIIVYLLIKYNHYNNYKFKMDLLARLNQAYTSDSDESRSEESANELINTKSK